uniref:Uncharacterized protein n=1 Tax=Picea sitchensis TaxID=3332 RepID=A0A6B9XWT7_PICSI|nr:hypothetical protein Q903MT_gene5787 [Picea sitchensis]
MLLGIHWLLADQLAAMEPPGHSLTYLLLADLFYSQFVSIPIMNWTVKVSL